MITKILWLIIAIAIIAIFLMGTNVLTLIIGIIAIVFGALNTFNKNFYLALTRTFPDSEGSKKLFPGNSLYINRRYLSGIGLIIIGILTILIYIY